VLKKRASTPPPPPAETPPPAPAQPGKTGIPVSVVLAALLAGGLAVAVAALVLRYRPGAPAGPAASATVDTAAAADTALDVRWRSGRMDGVNCIGTFEVIHGGGTPAHFVAFVMDKSGAVIGRDSANVPAAKPGVLVDLTFRRVTCDNIDDWQLQVATPKTGSD